MRRLIPALLFVLFVIFMAPLAKAQTTYYIDYASGSNSNNGTSKVTPWKSHPYMQNAAGCAGAPHAYSHVAGDQFIFKGGVTWPAACFSMNISQGGNSGAPDYYGVDLTWFTGGAFTRPIFDGANTQLSGDYRASFILAIGLSFITIDNLELKNEVGTGSTFGDPSVNSAINFGAGGTNGTLVKNVYIHGYTKTAANVASAFNNAEGGVYGAGTLDRATLVGDGGVIGTPPGSVSLLGCAYQVLVISNTSCDHYAQGVNGALTVHDSSFSNGNATVNAYAGGVHTNDIQDTGQVGMSVYNNVIHDSSVGQHVGITPYGKVYNNVMWNISGGASSLIGFDTGISNTQSYPGSVGYALNNTLVCGSYPFCITTNARAGTTFGTINLENNHLITNQSSFDAGTGGTQFTSGNIPMSTTTAASQSYTAANKYRAGGSTVGAGTSLSAQCGSFTGLCSDTEGAPWFGANYVPRGATWDAGAYQSPFSGTTASPAAPTNFQATVSGSTVNASWTASSGSPAPTAYTLYRGTVHGGPYSVVKSGLTTTSTTDTPPNGTWFYVVAAYVGGIVSSVSGTGSVATVTCTAACAFPAGTTFVLGGNSVSGFNGTFSSTSQPTASTFTFASSTGGTGTGGGVWQPVSESAKSNEVQVTVPAALTATLTPSSRTFAAQTVGTSSASQSFTYSNTSGPGGTNTISSKSITGPNAGDFSFNDNCPSLVLSGLSCTANVTFTPTAGGARTASLVFVDNTNTSPHTVALNGTGVAATPAVTLTPTFINFGDQTVSTTSTQHDITLQNSGSGTLTITSITPSGDFGETTTCGGTLAPAQACIIHATFTPTATGVRNGTISIVDNAAGSPHVVTLTGNGITTKCAMTGAVTLSGLGSVCQ